MKTHTITFDEEDIGDEEMFRRRIRMQCHISGYEVVDYDLVGQDAKPYVIVKKKVVRKTRQPKERFFR